MLKKRVIPILLFNNNRLVKSSRFHEFRDVGDPKSSAKVYYSQNADELLLLNIDRLDKRIPSFVNFISDITQEVFCPITVGGGITSLKDAEALFYAGADKIVLNTILYKNYELAKKISNKYGVQSVVASLDFKKINGKYILFSHNGSKQENVTIEEHINSCEINGVGEFLVQSIDEDGRMSGFDLGLFEYILEISRRPIIGAGGSGCYEHLFEAFSKTEVHALGCGSLFNFSDSNPLRAAAYLKNQNISIKDVE